MIAGVCAGIGAAYGVNFMLVRVAFVALALLGGAGIVVYIALWLLLPAAGRNEADRTETAREGAVEIADAARVASGHAVTASRTASVHAVAASRTASVHAVAASRTASVHAVAASRTASVLAAKAARSASAAVRRRTSGASADGSASVEADRPEEEKNSPAGPIP